MHPSHLSEKHEEYCIHNGLQLSEVGAAVGHGVAIVVECLVATMIITIAILCWWR